MDFKVSPSKEIKLKNKMNSLNIYEKDIEEKFIKGSGRGGQKINKSSSCVFLKHKPTGITIKCRKYRDLNLNRYLARKQLCEQIELLKTGSNTKLKKLERIKKQKLKRKKRAKLKYKDKNT